MIRVLCVLGVLKGSYVPKRGIVAQTALIIPTIGTLHSGYLGPFGYVCYYSRPSV